MSEAAECDRCGALVRGSPDTSIHVVPGYERSRHPEREPSPNTLREPLVDLCAGCRNALRRWWTEAGGDAADVRHSGVADE